MKCKPRLKLSHDRSIVLFIHPWSGGEEEVFDERASHAKSIDPRGTY